MNDGLLIIQNKSFQTFNTCLFSSYNIAFNLLSKFGLVVKHSKTEVFHFSRSQKTLSPSPLNLSSLGSPILYPKDTYRYLGFIFDRKLLFRQHIDFYANKAISTVKCMKILSNLMRGLNSQQKQLLYRSCALPIALYGFQMWYYNKASLLYSLKTLGKLQRWAALWIVGVRNRPATGPVMLKVCNVKLSFDIWLVLYIYFILYSWQYPPFKACGSHMEVIWITAPKGYATCCSLRALTVL